MRLYGGYITIKSLESGEHRTFRVRRRRDDAKFAPGERTVGLLVGQDNTSDYRDFAFVGDNGRVFLWRSVRGQSFYEWVAKCLNNPERFLHKVEFNFDARCRRCLRPLTTPRSVELGLGPDCAELEGFA